MLFSKFHFKFLGGRFILKSTSWSKSEPLLKILILPNLFWNDIRVSKRRLFGGHLFLYVLLKWFCSCSGAGVAHPNWEAKDEEGRRFAEARDGFRSGCGGVSTASSEHAWTSPNIHTSTVPNRFPYMARGEIIKCDFRTTPKTWGMRKGSDECRDKKSARNRSKGTCSLKEIGFL